MRPIDKIELSDGSRLRTIGLYEGDLASLAPEHGLDILVISAFPNDYTPTDRSLIGALHRRHLSVAELARNKLYDFRTIGGFWLSPQISTDHNIKQIACFEPATGTPPEKVGALFRGLMPFLPDDRDQIVGMPLLASGDQAWPGTEMLHAMLEAAAHWMARGAGISELKIVIKGHDKAAVLAQTMKDYWRANSNSVAPTTTSQFDVFLSFSSLDAKAATLAKDALLERSDVRTVFDFRQEIHPGRAWQDELDKAIHSARFVIPLISPAYLASAECQEELSQARLRNKRERSRVLFPVYWRAWSGDLALWLQLINAADCREGDPAKLSNAIHQLQLN